MLARDQNLRGGEEEDVVDAIGEVTGVIGKGEASVGGDDTGAHVGPASVLQ